MWLPIKSVFQIKVRPSSRIPLLIVTDSPQHLEPSPKAFIEQRLFPDEHDETLPDDDDEEDDCLSMVALETELQKYLHED